MVMLKGSHGMQTTHQRFKRDGISEEDVSSFKKWESQEFFCWSTPLHARCLHKWATHQIENLICGILDPLIWALSISM